MQPFLPGAPFSNPILGGLKALLEGGDLETALIVRDLALQDTRSFLGAGWEALRWLAPQASEIAQALMMQMDASLLRVEPQQARDHLDQAMGEEQAGTTGWQEQWIARHTG